MTIPKTISTQPFHVDIKQKILVPKEEFIKLVIQNKNDYVFCCKHERSLAHKFNFYLVIEGYCFYTESYLIKDYEKFIEASTFQNYGYGSFNEYAEALIFGLSDREEYDKFRSSGFLNINNLNSYKEFKVFQNGGFYNKPEYLEAQKLKISSKIEYDQFLNSGFQHSNEFSMAKKQGFLNKDDYQKARNSGFNNHDEYIEFLKSGCINKEDFEFFREKLPQLIKNNEETLKFSIKDANKAFDSGNFEEFIRLYYLAIEKLTETFYLKIFRRDLKNANGKIIDDMIEDIENDIKKSLVDINELKYWRRIRNKVIHQNLKIDKDKAEKGKEFFDEFYIKIWDPYTKYKR